MCQLIDSELGYRVKTVGFSYSDIIKNLSNIFYSGGDCAEDIQTHLGKNLYQATVFQVQTQFYAE